MDRLAHVQQRSSRSSASGRGSRDGSVKLVDGVRRPRANRSPRTTRRQPLDRESALISRRHRSVREPLRRPGCQPWPSATGSLLRFRTPCTVKDPAKRNASPSRACTREAAPSRRQHRAQPITVSGSERHDGSPRVAIHRRDGRSRIDIRRHGDESSSTACQWASATARSRERTPRRPRSIDALRRAAARRESDARQRLQRRKPARSRAAAPGRAGPGELSRTTPSWRPPRRRVIT